MPGRLVRGLHEQSNPRHRLRVEHDAHTLLVHLSDEEGGEWTTFAVDRRTRQWAVAQAPRQIDAASEAYDGLYKKQATKGSLSSRVKTARPTRGA